jgi:cyclase
MKLPMIAVRAALLLMMSITGLTSYAQNNEYDKITIRTIPAGGSVYFLDCVDGFGGGNVAASVGKDGILLVDNMFAVMAPKLKASLKQIKDAPVKVVVTTHFHGDHIQANKVFRESATIVAHENTAKQLIRTNSKENPTDELMPMIKVGDRMIMNFNDEEIRLIHYPNSHTEGDLAVYFTKSGVLHLGDMFFFQMFPGIYKNGGGDLKGLISSLEKILAEFPADTKVIPGHGDLATMKDLANYTAMLKETTSIVEQGIGSKKTLEQLTKEKVLAKYDVLGAGGAQTTDQYLAMLYKLLTN